jgi:hypothetical protein
MSFLIFPREVIITSNGGKGGDNRGNQRRSFRRRGHNKESREERQNNKNSRSDKNHRILSDRPQWTPPQIPSEPLPVLECQYCGKPIRDIASAVADKGNNNAVHFDCIIAKITEEEHLERGESIAYIGGGRFGIVRFNDPPGSMKFTIKKILEWENKDERAQWRSQVSDHFSVT